MSKKDGILNLILKSEWFDKIASGKKTHEYREHKLYWCNLLFSDWLLYQCHYKDNKDKVKTERRYRFVRFQKGFKKNPEKIMFEIERITIKNGKETDLKVEGKVYDIELGKRSY